MAVALKKRARRATLPRVRAAYRARAENHRSQGSAVPRRRKEIDPGAIDLPARFARRLQALMKEKGWSSQDVSDRLEAHGLAIGPRGVDFWLRGDGSPKFRDLETIGRALGFKDYRFLLPPPIAGK